MDYASYRSFVLPIGILVTTLTMWGAPAEEKPNPTAILQGLLSARLQIPSGKLQLLYTYQDSLVTNQSVLNVDFDGDRHAFTYRPEPGRKGWQTIFDGTQVIAYSEEQGNVQLMNLDQQMGMSLFDPRTLGLSTGYSWLDDVRSKIPLKWAVRVELLGKEDVSDHPTWHVRLIMPVPGNIPNATAMPCYDYWVDADNRFRVYRLTFNGEESLSFYGGAGEPWLPTRVTTTTVTYVKTVGRVLREWEILEARWNAKIPGSRWSLAGMGLKAGTDVIDDRINRRVGFWNGTRYVALHPELEQRSPRAKLVTWIVCGGLLLLPPLIMWYQRSRAAHR